MASMFVGVEARVARRESRRDQVLGHGVDVRAGMADDLQHPFGVARGHMQTQSIVMPGKGHLIMSGVRGCSRPLAPCGRRCRTAPQPRGDQLGGRYR